MPNVREPTHSSFLVRGHLIGGFEIALQRWGVHVVASCEIDKHARKVLTRHFPETKLFHDVTTLTGQELFDAGFESDGIICGGFPCQDVSVAGKRAGLSDSEGNATRSGLFWQVVRLLQETKAQHFILENVPGLLSSNEGRDFAVVLDALVELGYGVSWRILDAQYFGVPQRRKRIFIVGHLGSDGRTSAEILAIAEGRRGYLAKGEQTGKATSYSVGASVTPYRESSFGQFLENEIGTLKASGGVLGGGQRNIVGALTSSDLTKGQTNHQSIASNLLVVE